MMAMQRVLKGLAIAVAALFVVALLAVTGLWWWSGSEGSLAWVLARIERTQPVTAEGVRGSLRSGLRIHRLTWEKDGVQVQADDVDLAWQPFALLGGVIKLNGVHAAALRITDRRPPPPEPAKPPLSLAIKPRVVLDDLTIGHLEWNARNTIQADALVGHYSFDGTDHHVKIDSLRWAGGNYRGEAKLGALAPLPLDATLTGNLEAPVPGAKSKLPLEFVATLKGPITDFGAQARLQATQPGAGTDAPHATATARITPWAVLPVHEAQADLQAVDVGALWPQAPHTSLAGHVQVVPTGTATWKLTAALRNDLPGPWDQERLPVQQLQAEGEWRDGVALVQNLDARLGGGEVKATGRWSGGKASDWTMQAQVNHVDPSALHSQAAGAPLGGRAQARAEQGAIAFDIALQAGGAVPKRPARATKAKGVAADLGALDLRQVTARGRWKDGHLSLPTLDVRAAEATLQGAVELEIPARAGSGHVQLQAPGLRVDANGELAETRGRGTLHVDASNVALAQRWLRRFPSLPAALHDSNADGRASLEMNWQGGWHDPNVQGRLAVPSLQWRAAVNADPNAAPAWVVRDLSANVDGRLSNATLDVRAAAQQGQRQMNLVVAAQGGRAPFERGAAAAWRTQIGTITLSVRDPAVGNGPWQLALQRPFDARWSPGASNLEVTSGQAVLTAPPGKSAAASSQAVIAWDPVRWRAGELQTAGRITGLPMGWLELVGGPQLAGSALSGDMVFDGQWDANLGSTLRLNASLARSRGDVNVLADTAQGTSTRVAAGVRDARLTVASQGDQVTLGLHWASERAGVAEGRLVTRLSRGGSAGWEWPPTAPIDGALQARLPRIGVWSLLAPPGWRLRGSLQADVKASGTRGDPQLSGTVAADDLALRSVVDGVELQGGKLRAQLEGNRVRVTEFVLHGGGEGGAGGTLTATGDAALVNGHPQVQAQLQLARLRASIRSDRRLTISGEAAMRMDAAGSQVTGKLKVDQALIVLPEEAKPQLGNDVVVHDAQAGGVPKKNEAEPAPEPANAKPVVTAIDLDLGDDFEVRGKGLSTRLRGTLALSGRSIAEPRLVGTITTSGGEYQAYGQRLDVERGVLRFTGRVDNPSLDVLAIRPNLTQRVGVQINGTAQAPFVRLYAEPDLPDSEKLAWLVTGHAAPAGGAEAELVQQAALALLSSRHPGATGLAGRVGLDVLSVRRDNTEGTILTLGKRFTRNFYASYERSLSGALGTLYIFYDVSRRVTVRAQAGEQAGVDLIFTFAFD
jgi:translocation and assembly module TamB